MAKARSFEKFTVEKFLFVASISSGIDIRWFDIVYGILCVMLRGDNQSQVFEILICYLLEQNKVELVDVKLLHPIKLMNSSVLEMFKKNNLPTGVDLLAIKKENKEEHEAKGQTRQAKTPSKCTKIKLVLSSD